MATLGDATSGTVRDDFLDGLRNAHAVEAQAAKILERQVDRLTEYPVLVGRLKQHLDETHRQQKRLEDILAGMGESHSSLKDLAMGFMGNMAALGHAAASDEVIKNTLENAAFEHYEAAMYKALLAMADAAGATHATERLQDSLHEEQQMAAWVDENVADITRTYLARHERGDR